MDIAVATALSLLLFTFLDVLETRCMENLPGHCQLSGPDGHQEPERHHQQGKDLDEELASFPHSQ